MLNEVENYILGNNRNETELLKKIEALEDEISKLKNSSTSVPVGTVIAQMGNRAPEGYLKCDGTVYDIADYPKLADYFKEQFKDTNGNDKVNYFGGDGVTTFAVPNLQGEFLRGTGTNIHTSQGSGETVGIHQDATVHLYTRVDGGAGHIGKGTEAVGQPQNMDSIYRSVAILSAGAKNFSWVNSGVGEYTSRPTNTSVLYCIKY